MSQFKVFVTRRLPIALDQLQQIASVEVWTERQPPPYDVLLEKIKAIANLVAGLNGDRLPHCVNPEVYQ